MLRDLWTVTHKEWLEILDQFLRLRRGGWSILLVVFFLGIFVPLQLGPGWANIPVMFFYWPFLTASMTSTIVSDAVAGERERHTLETLLSTRLSDAAVLGGKVLASVLYGYAFALSNLAIGMVTVHVRFGPAAESMSLPRFLSLLALLGSTATLVSGLGVLASLRAATARQAQQLFGVIMLVAMMVPLALSRLLPEETVATFVERAQDMGVEGVSWRIAGFATLVALALLAFSVNRFKRGEVELG